VVAVGVGGLGLHGCESGLHPDTFHARRQAVLSFRAAALARLGLAPSAPRQPSAAAASPLQLGHAPEAAAVALARAALARECHGAAQTADASSNATAVRAAALLRAAADALSGPTAALFDAGAHNGLGATPVGVPASVVRVLVVQRSDRRRFVDVNRLAAAVREAATPQLRLAVKVTAHAARKGFIRILSSSLCTACRRIVSLLCG
jgi:hypothetical protein